MKIGCLDAIDDTNEIDRNSITNDRILNLGIMKELRVMGLVRSSREAIV
jgi:hypothetical protein